MASCASPPTAPGCVPGTARILKGAMSQAYPLLRGSSSPNPSPMEAKGIAVWQPGIRRRCLGRRPPCHGRVPRTHGAMNKNRVRRVWWDEPATQGKVLYPSQAKHVYSASMCGKMRVHPGRSATMSFDGLTEPQGEAITWQKSAEGIVVGGNEPGLSIPGGLTPTKARTVPGPNGTGKWSW